MQSDKPKSLAQYDGKGVIRILRELTGQSIAYLFEDGEKPHLNKSDFKTLKPLLTGSNWLRKRPGHHLDFLNSVLYFTGKDSDFQDNLMVLAVGENASLSGGIRGVIRSLQTKQPGLLGGDEIWPIAQWIAWSDGSLHDFFLRSVRSNWRARTLLKQDELIWPDRASEELLFALVCLALQPEQITIKGRFAKLRAFLQWVRTRKSSTMRKKFEKNIDSALREIATKPDFEHLLLLDVIARFHDRLDLALFDELVSVSPFASGYGLKRLDEDSPADMLEEQTGVSESETANPIYDLGQKLASGLL